MSTCWSPRNKRLTAHGCNIGGAEYLRELLRLLGFPETHLSGVGCGPRITAATSRDWAQALTQALDSNRIGEVFRKHRFLEQVVEVPVLKDVLIPPLGNPIEEEFFRSHQITHVPRDPNDECINWLRGVAIWWSSCGGFTQS